MKDTSKDYNNLAKIEKCLKMHIEADRKIRKILSEIETLDVLKEATQLISEYNEKLADGY